MIYLVALLLHSVCYDNSVSFFTKMYKFFLLKGDKKSYEVCNDFDKRTDGRTDRICLPFSAMQQEEQNNNGVTLRHDILMSAER